MNKFKLNDYIILSDEGIESLVNSQGFKKENVIKRVLKITEIEIQEDETREVFVDGDELTHRSPIGEELFRLATEVEIKKQQIKEMFVPYIENEDDLT